jgi:hypothetical protein
MGRRATTEFGAFDAATNGNMNMYAELVGVINLKAATPSAAN